MQKIQELTESKVNGNKRDDDNEAKRNSELSENYSVKSHSEIPFHLK